MISMSRNELDVCQCVSDFRWLRIGPEVTLHPNSLTTDNPDAWVTLALAYFFFFHTACLQGR